MLTELPVIVVDSILTWYVSDNDLRVIHQVCKGWKNLIDVRPLVNARRFALVNTIREHKENIRNSTQPLVLPPPIPEPKSNNAKNPTKESHNDKTGSGSGRTLRSLSNHLLVTPATSVNSSGCSTSGRRRVTRISSTPKSRYQRRLEAGLKLMPGQVLFSCPGCNSPVPSPVPAHVQTQESTIDSGIGLSGISLDGDLSQIRLTESSSSIFKFDSPDIETSINISMIATPPCTPPIFELGTALPGSVEESATELEITRSSCQFLAVDSGLDLPESSTSLEDNNNCTCKISNEIQLQLQDIPKSISQTKQLVDVTITPENSNSTDLSDQTSLLRSLHAKQLKLKSCSSPSLLVSEVKTDVIGSNSPAVIQCPDCSLRFCSQCQFREHLGKPCRVLGGDEMYEESDDSIPLLTSLPPPITAKPRARSATGSANAKSNKKKGSLRRLAYL